MNDNKILYVKNYLNRLSFLLKIVQLWKPHWLVLGGGMVASAIAMVSMYVLMAITGLRAGALLTGTSLATGMALQVFGCLRIILRFFERLFTHNAMFKALSDVRLWFFRNLAYTSAAGLGFKSSGDMLTRLVTDIGALDNLYLRLFIPFLCALLTLVGLFLLVINISVSLAIVLTVLLSIALLGFPVLMAWIAYKVDDELAVQESALRHHILNALEGLREIKAFGIKQYVEDQINQSDDTFHQLQMRMRTQFAWAHAGVFFIGQMSLAVVLYAMSIHWGTIKPIFGVVILFVLMASIELLVVASRSGTLLGQLCQAAVRVMAVKDDGRGESHSGDHGKKSSPIMKGTDICFSNVSFCYGPDEPTVLNNINLYLPFGCRVAITGPSGAGKSTLLALLLKVLRPTSGTISLGDDAIQTLDDSVVRATMAWLSQQTHLFSDTIRANLLLGDPNASDEQLWQALEQASIDKEIRNLPDKLDTWVGEGGINFSGGQGRRIVLARTLLSTAPILLLDEPYIGLDAATGRDFFSTFNQIVTGRTLVMVTHHLLGVEGLDRVYRLDHGRLNILS